MKERFIDRYERGCEKLYSEDYQGALKVFDFELADEPANTFIYFVRGQAKFGLNDFQGAIEDFDLFLDNEEENSFIYYERGKAKAEAKDLIGALADFEKALQISQNLIDEEEEPDDEMGETCDDYLCHLNLEIGKTKILIEDYKGAIKYFTNTIDIDPFFKTALTLRGTAKYLSNDKRGAYKDWRIAWKNGDEEAHEKLKAHCKNI